MDGGSDGSVSKWRGDGYYKRCNCYSQCYCAHDSITKACTFVTLRSLWKKLWMYVTSDGSWRNPRSDWSRSKLSIRMQAMGKGQSDGSVNNKWLGWWMDQWTIEGSIDGSGSNRRNDGWCKWWMDQETLDGATDGTCDGIVCNRRSDGSVSKWRRDGHYKRHNWRKHRSDGWIRDQ